ncbi:MAG: hypothetical protein GXO62_02760 [Epsilonproteobacteria bacterium]|nr:hypothetical protein [Campylobacterota bacterium]
MKKLSTALIIGASALLIGCGGGGSSSESDTTPTLEKTQETTITASDAYVVKLYSPAVANCNGKIYKSTTVNDGNITFELDENVNPQECIYNIPDDAIVDTDGDGNFSNADLPIRMPLSLQGVGVANPLTTAALNNNDIQTLQQTKDFDPVRAKLQLLQDVNDTSLQAKVALSDAIADLVKAAKDENISVNEVLKNIDTTTLNEIANGEVNATDVVKAAIDPAIEANPELSDNAQEIVQKVNEEIELAKTLSKHIKENHLDHHTALALMLMASDGDANVSIDENASEEELYQIQEMLKQQLEEKHQEAIQEIEEMHQYDLNHTVEMQEDAQEHATDMQQIAQEHQQEVEEIANSEENSSIQMQDMAEQHVSDIQEENQEHQEELQNDNNITPPQIPQTNYNIEESGETHNFHETENNEK